METQVAHKSPLHKMTQTTPTALWNDSASMEELTYSIENGAIGATCNPVIVAEILRSEMPRWVPRIRHLIQEMRTAAEDEIAWKIVEDISVNAAALLRPIFDRENGRNGRLSAQTDPRRYRDAAAIVRQAERFNQLAPNMIVKIPATSAGIAAIEECTVRGISINATVCFTLPQCVAVAEAVERGLKRREAEGKEIFTMGPVCTIMVGRLDDWLKVVAQKRRIPVDPSFLEWAGIAVFKKTYRLFRDRGYRLRLLSAAFRNENHCHELIGGDVVISPPHKWQVQLNASTVEIVARMDNPVRPGIVDSLLKNFDDFRCAYTEGGLTPEEFDSFPSTRRTLRQFIAACYALNGMVGEIMIPDPDKEPVK